MKTSILQSLRSEYRPKMPSILMEEFDNILIEKTLAKKIEPSIAQVFKNTAQNSLL